MTKGTDILSISADGYGAGNNQSEVSPFGDDTGDGWGNKLHDWTFANPEETEAHMAHLTEAKALTMGRNMFGPVRGKWDREWNGWWGDNPPYHAPTFVLTH